MTGKPSPAGWRSWVPGALAVLALTLPALWPLFKPGFLATDDGLFHIYRIAALADAWSHGVLYPRLFPDFGFGYGQAVLNFYAPLSYAPAAGLSLLGLSPVAAAKIVLALGFLLAALAAYGFARSLWGTAGGVLAAVAYTYFPYHLADAYVRGAIPEHFAFIWPPLILWALAGAFRDEDARPAALAGALAWAALLFTHNLTALLMIPVAAFYVLALGLWTRQWRRCGWAAASVLLAALLSAPLWLPFLAESGSVGIALGPSDGYRRHLAPASAAIQWAALYRYRDQPGTAADHPLPWTTLALLALVVGLAVWRLLTRRGVRAGPVIAFFALLTIVSAFLTTQPALPIWIPLERGLAQLQYPWRFLALTAVGVMGLAGALPGLLGVKPGTPSRFGLAVSCVIGAGLMFHPLFNVPATSLPMTAAEAWSPDRMWREDAAAGQVGATWTAEFLPLTVREQRWALGRARDGAADGPALAPRPAAQIAEMRYDGLDLQVESTAPLILRLHQFHLPAWRTLLNARPATTYASGELGLVTVDAPAGTTLAKFQFGPTTAWVAGWLLALAGALAWAVLAGLTAADRRAGNDPHHRLLMIGAALVPLTALILVLNGMGIGRSAWTPRLPVNGPAVLGDVALLMGYDIAPARGERAQDVTLYWFALRETATNYQTFVHLLDASGQVLTQHDGDPGGGYTPTTRWMAGEVIPDRHRLVLPDNAPAGTYGLRAGMYGLDAAGAAGNLPVDPPTSDGRVDLGAVEISP